MDILNFFSETAKTLVALVFIPLGKKLFNLIMLKIQECEHQALRSAATILVAAADQMFKEKTGSQKMNYVTSRLKKKFSWASDTKIKELCESICKKNKK